MAWAKLAVKTGDEVWRGANAESLEGPGPAAWISADFEGGGGASASLGVPRGNRYPHIHGQKLFFAAEICPATCSR